MDCRVAIKTFRSFIMLKIMLTDLENEAENGLLIQFCNSGYIFVSTESVKLI